MKEDEGRKEDEEKKIKEGRWKMKEDEGRRKMREGS